MNVSKFVLNDKTTIYLREPVIGDTEEAAKIAGKVCDPKNQAHMSMVMQKEVLKRLLVKVNSKVLTMVEKEQLDKLFTFKEYNLVGKALAMVLGDESEGNVILTPEFETIGATLPGVSDILA